MDLNLIAGVCLQDSFAIPLTTVSDSRCKNGLCRNVILRRSRSISSSYGLEKARCDALRRFTRGPENRIALPGKNDDMRAGAVLMPFLVSADRELGDMRAHGVLGQVEFHVRAALAALAVIGELEGVRVGHKVRGQEK